MNAMWMVKAMVLLSLWAAGPVSAGEATVAAGSKHSCAIDEGWVWCWGDNAFGQLGVAIGEPQPSRVQVPNLAGVVAITAGSFHTCALRFNGDVWCWGANDNLQLGSPTPGNNPSATPLKVAGLPSPVTAIAAGAGHTCALRDTGTVMCWGANDAGQLGRTTLGSPQVAPALVIGVTQAVALGTGLKHSCAVQAGGLALCWGANTWGQLGRDTQNEPAPIAGAVAGLTEAVEISAGEGHTCAIKGDGTAWCWGNNNFGQLGMGSLGAPQPTPQPVIELTQTTGLAADTDHTCARRSDGTVKCWGRNGVGQLGLGHHSYSSSVPTTVTGLSGAMVLAAGYQHTCARRMNGNLDCWGSNESGQLGIGQWGGPSAEPQPTGLAGIGALSAGMHHTCGVKGADSTVVCWGRNEDGQLGIGAVSPMEPTPQPVSGLGAVTAVSAGRYHTCALTSSGTVACWGYNGFGQLGTGNTTSHSTPQLIEDLDGVMAVSAGRDHTCALKSTGAVLCWGGNDYGQLGTGDTAPYLTPEPVDQGQVVITALSAGSYHTCALNAAGAVLCWGSNHNGQLGRGSIDSEPHPTPASVSPVLYGAPYANPVARVMAGVSHTCAQVTVIAPMPGLPRVFCWGNDGDGQLGNGPAVTESQGTPQLVGQGLSLVAAGGDSACARSTQSMVCWGYNGMGLLATGAFSNHPAPVPSIGFAAATTVTIGDSHACASSPPLGTVACAGRALYGERGDGAIGHWPAPLPVIGFDDALFADDFELVPDE